MHSRRDLVKLALGTLGASRLLSAKPNSVVHGVIIGAQSYSFRDRPLDEAIKGMVLAGLSHCELWQGHIEPQQATRKGLREWRENIALEQFDVVRSKFLKAGVKLYAYNYSFQDDFSDREIALLRLAPKIVPGSDFGGRQAQATLTGPGGVRPGTYLVS